MKHMFETKIINLISIINSALAYYKPAGGEIQYHGCTSLEQMTLLTLLLIVEKIRFWVSGKIAIRVGELYLITFEKFQEFEDVFYRRGAVNTRLSRNLQQVLLKAYQVLNSRQVILEQIKSL